MHEFAICEDIVQTVLGELDKLGPGCRLQTVRMVVGRMHQIVPDNILFAYEALTKGTVAEGSRLDIRFIPISVKCRDCEQTSVIEAPLFRCPACGSGEVEVMAGRELFLENMEIEQDDEREH